MSFDPATVLFWSKKLLAAAILPPLGPLLLIAFGLLLWQRRPRSARVLAWGGLLLALALGRPKRALWFAGICTLGSVLGGALGYAIGWFVWEGVSDFFFGHVPGVTPEGFAIVQDWYQRWGFWAVFLAGFTPLPYKVFTLASGVFQISFPVFIIASAISRGARFFIVATLVYFFGAPIQSFIDRHFNRLAWLFGVLLVGGFVALRFLR